MSSASSVDAALRPETRQQIVIEALPKIQPISHLVIEYEVSRQFVYEQSEKAQLSLSAPFEPTIPDEQVLFHLPITKSCLLQLMLGLVLICHGLLRGVVELFQDVFDLNISSRKVSNRLRMPIHLAREMCLVRGMYLLVHTQLTSNARWKSMLIGNLGISSSRNYRDNSISCSMKRFRQ